MSAPSEGSRDLAEVVDVVVVGSGAGGLAAAHGGLSVVVAEKTNGLAGHPQSQGVACGILLHAKCCNPDDSSAAKYLGAVLGTRYDAQKAVGFLEDAPKAAALIGEVTGLTLVPNGQTDYEAELPGAAPSRSMLSNDFDGRKLGVWLSKIRPVLPRLNAPFGLPIGVMDIQPPLNVHWSWESFWKVFKLYVRHTYNRARFGRTSRMVNGNALGALRLGAKVFKPAITFAYRTARSLPARARRQVVNMEKAPLVELT